MPLKVDIDQLLAGRSEAELEALAAQALRSLIEARGTGDEPLSVFTERFSAGFAVYPLRPTTGLDEKELQEEMRRRVEAPALRSMSPDEFLASFDA